MNRSRLKHILMESGLCVDRVWVLDWILKHPWARSFAFRFLRLRVSPAILKDALVQIDPEERERLFSLGMSNINVGDTYKTTARARTTLADNALQALARGVDAPKVLEIGVSDGSSSLGLLGASVFDSVILTDRFSRFYEKKNLFGAVYRNADAALLGVKFLFLYCNVSSSQPGKIDGYSVIETANPALERLHGLRSIVRFNMQTDVLDEKVHLIKCANILNRSYFTARQIRKSVTNLARSLADGGVLVLSQNNSMYADGEALLVVRKTGEKMVIERNINNHAVAPILECNSEPLSVYFLIPSLESGGAERQVVQLANGLARQGKSVHVGLFRKKGCLLNELDPAVTVVDLKKKGQVDILGFLYRLIQSVRKSRAEVLYSFLAVPNLASIAVKPFLPRVSVICPYALRTWI